MSSSPPQPGALPPGAHQHHHHRRGARVVVLAADNHATRLALRMAGALLRPGDELRVATVVRDDGGDAHPPPRALGEAFLAQLIEGAPPRATGGARPTPVVLAMAPHERFADVVAGYAVKCRAELVVCGSHHLCARGTRDDPLPASGSVALRVARAVRSCPVLVVKPSSVGHYLAAGSAGKGLRVLVDCQPSARPMVAWLMGRLDAAKDGLFLAVQRGAHDAGDGAGDQRPGPGSGLGGGGASSSGGGSGIGGSGGGKEAARRVAAYFSVQASVGGDGFYTARRLLRDRGARALAAAAVADAADVVAVQAPPCKGLPEATVELLHAARAAVLIYHRPPSDGGSAGSSGHGFGIGLGLGECSSQFGGLTLGDDDGGDSYGDGGIGFTQGGAFEQGQQRSGAAAAAAAAVAGAGEEDDARTSEP